MYFHKSESILLNALQIQILHYLFHFDIEIKIKILKVLKKLRWVIVCLWVEKPMKKFAIAFISDDDKNQLRHRIIDAETQDAAMKVFFDDELSDYYSNDLLAQMDQYLLLLLVLLW